MLSEAEIWNQDSDSELLLDIQYRSPTTSETEFDDQPRSSNRTTAAQKFKTIAPINIIPK